MASTLATTVVVDLIWDVSVEVISAGGGADVCCAGGVVVEDSVVVEVVDDEVSVELVSVPVVEVVWIDMVSGQCYICSKHENLHPFQWMWCRCR